LRSTEYMHPSSCIQFARARPVWPTYMSPHSGKAIARARSGHETFVSARFRDAASQKMGIKNPCPHKDVTLHRCNTCVSFVSYKKHAVTSIASRQRATIVSALGIWPDTRSRSIDSFRYLQTQQRRHTQRPRARSRNFMAIGSRLR
jgi:hypothetical protein